MAERGFLRWLMAGGIGLTLVVNPGTLRAATPPQGSDFGIMVTTDASREVEILNSVQAAHADWVEILLHWSWMAPKRNGPLYWEASGLRQLTDDLAARKLHVLFRIIDVPDWAGGVPARAAPADVAGFVTAVDAQLASLDRAYMVFNEVNAPPDWGWGGPVDPGKMVAQLQAVHSALRQAGSPAKVVSPGMAPATGGGGGSWEDVDFLRAMYALGLRGSVDAVAAELYGGASPPDADPSTCPIGMCFRRAERYRAIMEDAGDLDTPMWATEVGWMYGNQQSLGGFDWMKVSAEDQATYLVQARDYARREWPWMRVFILFNLDFSEILPPEEQMTWFSLLDPTGRPRPAYRRLEEQPPPPLLPFPDPTARVRRPTSVAPAFSPVPTPSPKATPSPSPDPCKPHRGFLWCAS